jgi:hypothetical protein
MSGWLADAVLLADQERFRTLGENLRQRRAGLSLTELLLAVACLAALLLAVWIAAHLLSRHQRERVIHHPRKLFRALSRAHAIGFWNRRTLWQLAQSADLSQPAMIFVRPDLLEARLQSVSNRRQQARYAQLRDKLFGAPAPPDDIA